VRWQAQQTSPEPTICEIDSGVDALACLQSAVQHHEDHTLTVTGGSFSEHVAFDVDAPVNDSTPTLFANSATTERRWTMNCRAQGALFG